MWQWPVAQLQLGGFGLRPLAPQRCSQSLAAGSVVSVGRSFRRAFTRKLDWASRISVRSGPSATPAFYAARRTVPASGSDRLWHPRDGLLVAGHLLGYAFVRHGLGDAQVRDCEAGIHRDALELLVLLGGVELRVGAVELDVAVEVAVGGEQGDVEALYTALLLQPAVEADRLVEHLETSLLAPGDRS